MGLEVLAAEALGRHFRAYPRTEREVLPVGGVLQWRRDGERPHLEPRHDRQPPARGAAKAGNGNGNGGLAGARDPRRPTTSSRAQANDESTRKAALRGLMTLRYADEPVPLEEVEPATEIVKRFTHRGDEPRLALAARPTRRWPSP